VQCGALRINCSDDAIAGTQSVARKKFFPGARNFFIRAH
jgi:hypothetical protein